MSTLKTLGLLTPLNIPIERAKTLAKNWQSANPNHAKAFLMPALDLMACMLEMGALVKEQDGSYKVTDIVNNSGIRAYMAIDPSQEEGFGEKLLIVGTTKDTEGNIIDIIEGRRTNSNALVDPVGSGVFDFTDPCPSECDEGSPLF
ncbi:hypothetical protein [Olleya sp. R77988]|uniref:hypothetical protein n=1 Tax=Olleya sp. R77988 TaxID=3093875 RepID=UPI0037C86615